MMDGIHFFHTWGCFLLVLMCSQVQRVECQVDVRITLKEYNHTVGERENSKCCQNIDSYACSTLQKLCDYKFELCLDSDSRPGCTTASKVFTPSNTANSFSFDSFAKIQLMLQDQWRGKAELKVVISDGDVLNENRVDTIKFTLTTLGTSPLLLSQCGMRTTPTCLSLEYTVTIPCRPASNCQEGFFACDSTGVQTCQPDYVEDGICKTQKVKNMCTLPANPSPAEALRGYFKGTPTCTDFPNELVFFNNPVASVAYIQYTKDGKQFREGLQLSQMSATSYTAVQGSHLLLNTGTPINVTGQVTLGAAASEFTYVFGSCTVNFTLESVSNTELCHGGGQCTKESGVEFCCCDPSFSGAFCEKQGDICSPNPCKSGANCTSTNATEFTCACSSGYYGRTCELTAAAVTCSGEVCSGSVCQKALVSPQSCECQGPITDTCSARNITDCPDNMYGPSCDMECIPMDDCEGHYTCDVTNGDIICHRGYKGDNCTERDYSGPGPDPECPASGSCPSGAHCFNGQCCCPEGCILTTESATTEATTTELATTEAATTELATTEAYTTELATTEAYTTEAATTEAATTEAATTEADTTEAFSDEETTEGVTASVTTASSSTVSTVVDGDLQLPTLSGLFPSALQASEPKKPQPQALWENSAPQTAHGEESQQEALNAAGSGGIAKYIPCPWTKIQEDVANNQIILTLDCTNRGLGSSIRATIKLVYVTVDGNTLTRFEYDAEDETVEKLLREAVEKTLKDKEVDVVDETVIKNSNLPFEFSYSLNISGTHLDKNWILNFTTAMAAAFSAKYPDKSNLKVWAPRVDDAIAENRLYVTAINYWVGIDGDKTNLLNPVQSAAPTNVEIVAAVKQNMGFSIQIYTGEVFSYLDSFGLFVWGKVFEQDLAKFERILKTWWQKDSGNADYKDVNVMIKSQERYFERNLGDWYTVSKLVYFVQQPDKSFVSGGWIDVATPSTQVIQQMVDFKAADGGEYTIVRSTSRKFKTSVVLPSIHEIVRARETYGLYIRGRYTTANLTTAIETNVVSLFNGSITVPKLEVLPSDELIGDRGETFSRINIAISNNGTVVDSRRMESDTPRADVITATIGSVQRANGEPYVFETNPRIIKNTVLVQSCFTQSIKGTVTVQDYEKFEAALLAGVMETNSDFKNRTAEVVIKTAGEMISQESETFTTLYYVLSVAFGDGKFLSDASIAIQNRVNVDTLRRNINFTRADGSEYEVIVRNSTAVGYRDTMPLFVGSTVARTDYSKFEAKLTALIAKEAISITNNQMVTAKIVKQERSISANGSFIYKLSYVVKAEEIVILPDAIKKIEPSRLQAEVKVTNPAGENYQVKQGSAEVASYVRESELFYTILTTNVAKVNEVTLQTALQQAWTEENRTVGALEIKIFAVMEFASTTGETFYKMVYSCKQEGNLISAMQEASIGVAETNAQISQVKNPQGVAYRAIVKQLSKFTDMTVGTSVVLATAFAESQTQEMMDAILAASSATLTGEAKTSLEISVIRQREVLDQTSGKFAYAVDYIVKIGVGVVSSSILPARDSATLESTFKASTGKTLEPLSVSLTEVHTVEASYSLVLNYDVEESKFGSFKTVIEDTLNTEAIFASSTSIVIVVTTEELIQKEKSTTFYNLRYLVQVDGKMLDARIDAFASTKKLTSKIAAANIKNVNGENFTLVNFNSTSENVTLSTAMSSMFVRKSQCASLTVNGEFSTGDSNALTTAVKNVINTSSGSKSVAVIQQRKKLDNTGGVFTEVLLEVKSGKKLINPAILDPINPETVALELSKQTLVKVGGYKLIPKSVGTTLMEANHAFTFILDAPVATRDISALEAKLTATFRSRATFSSFTNLKIEVVRQVEMLNTIGVSSRKVIFFLKSGTKTFKSTLVKRMSTTELTNSLSFSMSNRAGLLYSQVISADQTGTGMIRLSSLHFVTLKEKMQVSSFAKFEAAMVPVIAAASGLMAPTLKVVAQQEFVSVTGEINHRLLFSCMASDRLIRPVDFRTANARVVSSALIKGNVKSAKGVTFTVLEKTVADAQHRAAELFTFALDTQIQPSDIAIVQSTLAKAYSEVHVGIGLSNISVEIKRQGIVFNKLGGKFRKIMYSVKVNGTLESAIVKGQISSAKTKSSLMAIPISGSRRSFGSAVEDISVYKTYREESLAPIIVSEVVKGSLKLEIETAMAETLKASITSLANDTVTAKIVKQEEVITAKGLLYATSGNEGPVNLPLVQETTQRLLTEKKIKISFLIKAGTQKIDYRDVADFSRTILTAKIRASNNLVSAGIQFESNVDVSTSICISRATTIFFDNAIAQEDINKIMERLDVTYKAQITALSGGTFPFVGVRKAINAEGKTVTAFKFFVKKKSGLLIKQNLPKSVLSNALSSIVTSRQEKLAIVEETDTSTYIDKRTCFSLVLKTRIKKIDISEFEVAVAQAWLDKRQNYLDAQGAEWNITVLGQEEGIVADGTKAVKILYTVYSLSTRISKEFDETVTIASVKKYLDAVTKVGTTTKYGTEIVSDNNAANFVAMPELCLVVMDQYVNKYSIEKLSQAIATAWKRLTEIRLTEIGLTTPSITIKLQEEMILNQTTQKYGLYYQAVSPDIEIICPDFRPDFISLLKEILSQTGSELTVADVGQKSELILKSDTFFMFMSSTIRTEDFTRVEAAIAKAWAAANVGDKNITVKLSIQDEMINSQGKTLWKIHFIISSVSGMILPSTANPLTFAQLKAALDGVRIGSTDSFHGPLLLDTQLSVLHEYWSSFRIHVTNSVNDAGQTAFAAALKTAWTQSRKKVDVLILQQEEIVDALGKFTIRLTYALTVDGERQDSRVITQLPAAAIKTYIVGQVQGTSGPYVIEMSLISPLYRLSRCLKMFVDANVPNADNPKFEQSLTQVYRIKLQSSSVHIVFRDHYIKQGRFATALYYVVKVNGRLTPASDLPILTTGMQATIKISSGANTIYKIIADLSGLYRYRYRFAVYLSRTVLTIDVNSVLTGLLGQFKLAEPALARDLTAHRGVQEEAVDMDTNKVWMFVYFLKKNGEVVQSDLFTHLTSTAIKTALSVEVSGNQRYSDYILDKTQVYRLSDILSVALNSRLAASKFPAFESALTEAWKASEQDFEDIQVTVATEGKYVSKHGEIVYIVYYKASLNGRILSGLDFSIATDVLEKFIKVLSPQGILYSLYTDSIATLRRYESAFSFYLTRVAQSSDTPALMSGLQASWSIARKDLNNIVVETPMDEELILDTGSSIYKYSYFVSADEATVDALFDAPITNAQIRTALDVVVSGSTNRYSEYMHEVELTKVVAFADLIPVPFTTVVALADYTFIGSAVQTLWRAVGGEWSALEVRVRGQEEMLDEKGNFVYALLYSVTKEGKVHALEDLPELEKEALNVIEKLQGLQGRYTLSDVKIGDLRRYKLAMSVFLDKRVSFGDLNKLTVALQNTLKEIRQEFFAIRVKPATQLSFVTKEKSRVLKFVFFGYLGTRLLDGRRENVMDKAALSSRLSLASLSYQVVGTASLDGVRDLRMAHNVYIEGRVSKMDLASFTAGLNTIWQKIESKAEVEIVFSKDEFIGEKQMVVSGLVFFVMKEGKLISSLDPGGPTRETIARELMVTSQTGDGYKVYEGLVVSYLKQYSVLLVNEISLQETTPLVPVLKALWEDHLETDDIEVILTKAERNLGAFGGHVTKVMYSVKVDGQVTFPADRPSPSIKQMESAIRNAKLRKIQVFTGQAVTRVDLTYSVSVEGALDKTQGVRVMTGVRKVWGHGADASLTNPTYHLIGQFPLVSLSKRVILTKVIYQVQSDGKPVAVEDYVPPTVADIEAELRTSNLEVFGGAVLQVRNKYFQGLIPKFSFTDVESSIQAAWAAANVGNTIEISVNTDDSFISHSWSEVSRLGITVRFNDQDADRNAVAPPTEQLADKLALNGFSLCGCVAKRKYQTYIIGKPKDVNFKLQQLVSGLRKAWSRANPEISPSKFIVISKPLRQRHTNSAHNRTEPEYVAPDGSTVSPVIFTLDLDGQDPDQILVAPPDSRTLNEELLKAAGLKSCACIPRRCHVVWLKGEVKRPDQAKIIKALKQAYSSTNPDYQNIQVTLASINNDKKDPESGIIVGEVKYCVTSKLLEPSLRDLKDALKMYGKELFEGDFLDPMDNQWVLIIGIVCGAVALILLFLAVIKVCYRHRSQAAETRTVDHEAGGYSAPYCLDDEVYAGHGTYQQAFSKLSDADSVHFYGKGQMYDPKSYITTPGNMLIRN